MPIAGGTLLAKRLYTITPQVTADVRLNAATADDGIDLCSVHVVSGAPIAFFVGVRLVSGENLIGQLPCNPSQQVGRLLTPGPFGNSKAEVRVPVTRFPKPLSPPAKTLRFAIAVSEAWEELLEWVARVTTDALPATNLMVTTGDLLIDEAIS